MTKPTGEIHRTGIQRELPVKLSYDDLLDIAMNKSRLETEHEQKEQAMKDAKDTAKAELDALDERIAKLRHQLVTGERTTVVQCHERWKGNLLEIVREDTGAVIETRTATLKDTQADLPALAAAQADAAKAQADAGVDVDEDGNVIPIAGEPKKRKAK